jgi:hypothetical protein
MDHAHRTRQQTNLPRNPSLFGLLQVTAVDQIGMSDVLLALAYTTVVALGKMISPSEPRGGRGSNRFVGPRGRTPLKGIVGQGNPVAPDVPHRVAGLDLRSDGWGHDAGGSYAVATTT